MGGGGVVREPMIIWNSMVVWGRRGLGFGVQGSKQPEMELLLPNNHLL